VQALGSFDETGRYSVEPGRYVVWIGGNSRTGLNGDFVVK
jgi:hypothetical protein